MEVIAEGVEKDLQAKILLKLNVRRHKAFCTVRRFRSRKLWKNILRKVDGRSKSSKYGQRVYYVSTAYLSVVVLKLV